MVANTAGLLQSYRLLALCSLYKSRGPDKQNAIEKLSIKLGEYSGHYSTSLTCLDKLKIVWKEYQAAKKEAWSLQETFLEDKIARKAHNINVITENMVKMPKREQRSIQEGVKSRQIRGRNNKQPFQCTPRKKLSLPLPNQTIVVNPKRLAQSSVRPLYSMILVTGNNCAAAVTQRTRSYQLYPHS